MAEIIGNGLFIAGTDTDVGKTQVSAGLLGVLGSICQVAAWKPVQSGFPEGDARTDSHRLHRGGGLTGDCSYVASHTFCEPLAPWMAARRNQIHVDFQALVAEGKTRLANNEFLLVEGAGGVAVPITENSTIQDLMVGLELPAVIVARTGLGTVNHTVLTVESLRRRGVEILGVIMNDSCPSVADEQLRLERQLLVGENREMIERFADVRVLGCLPYFNLFDDVDLTSEDWLLRRAAWWRIVSEQIDLAPLLSKLKKNSRNKTMEGTTHD